MLNTYVSVNPEISETQSPRHLDTILNGLGQIFGLNVRKELLIAVAFTPNIGQRNIRTRCWGCDDTSPNTIDDFQSTQSTILMSWNALSVMLSAQCQPLADSRHFRGSDFIACVPSVRRFRMKWLIAVREIHISRTA
jgi:hypothetical protein